MNDVDAIPFPAGRTPNRPWQHRRGCGTCQDDALISVGDDPRSGTEQMAPCPECEAGFMVEYGYGRRSVAVGQSTKHVLYQRRSPWGHLGYWGRAAVARPLAAALADDVEVK